MSLRNEQLLLLDALTYYEKLSEKNFDKENGNYTIGGFIRGEMKNIPVYKHMQKYLY